MTVEEKEKIKTLYASGESYRAIARAIGKAPNTVKHYLKSSPAVIQEVEEKKKELVDFFDDIAKRMLSSITDSDITRLNAYHRTLSAGIATDKARLLKGQSTQIVDVLAQAISRRETVIDITPTDNNTGKSLHE